MKTSIICPNTYTEPAAWGPPLMCSPNAAVWAGAAHRAAAARHPE
jgi:hypothetical protein